MGAPVTEILRQWKDSRGVDCRILRNDGLVSQTWAESYYSGHKGEGPRWMTWLQASEANEILDRLAGEESAKKERDEIKAAHDVLFVENQSLKSERDALKAENDGLKKKP